jgi:hypothetical protein
MRLKRALKIGTTKSEGFEQRVAQLIRATPGKRTMPSALVVAKAHQLINRSERSARRARRKQALASAAAFCADKEPLPAARPPVFVPAETPTKMRK